MVNWWDLERQRSEKLLKFRITHHEKHGNGDVVMKEKYQLQKLQKKIKDSKIK